MTTLHLSARQKAYRLAAESSSFDIPTAAFADQADVTNWPEYPLVCFLMLTLVSASKADNRDSLAVFDNEDCVGHIMRTQKSPPRKPWFLDDFRKRQP